MEKACFCSAGLEAITVPGGVREIGACAFQNCRDLATVTLADGLEVLGDGCFRDTRIAAIRIPRTVRTIGKFAFRGCKQLEKLSFEDGSVLEEIKNFAFCLTPLRRASVALPPAAKVPKTAFSAEGNSD